MPARVSDRAGRAVRSPGRHTGSIGDFGVVVVQRQQDRHRGRWRNADHERRGASGASALPDRPGQRTTRSGTCTMRSATTTGSSNVQAAIGVAQLEELPGFIETRRHNHTRYAAAPRGRHGRALPRRPRRDRRRTTGSTPCSSRKPTITGWTARRSCWPWSEPASRHVRCGRRTTRRRPSAHAELPCRTCPVVLGATTESPLQQRPDRVRDRRGRGGYRRRRPVGEPGSRVRRLRNQGSVWHPSHTTRCPSCSPLGPRPSCAAAP